MRCVLFIGMLLAGSLSLQAQELSVADSAEVQQKALRHVRQLEGLLNLVAQPDRYFRKYSFAKLIRSFYSEQSTYQIFRDSLVAVEDDLNPNAHPDANNFLSIKDYLRGFFSFYEKAPVASVFFSNYQVSPIKEGEFTYVEVFYLSEFTNRHRAYPDQPYPVRHNKATLRAQRQEDGWKVVISNINYYLPEQELVASLPEDSSTQAVGDQVAQGSPSAQDTLDAVAASSSEAVSLQNLSDALTDSTQISEILERLDRGTNYQLRLPETVAVFEPTGPLPLVSSAVDTDISRPVRKSDAELLKRFAPLIEKAGPSSVRVIFDNPTSNPLWVELVSADHKVLLSEEVPSEQGYANLISLENFEEDSYQVRVFNRDYEHVVRVDGRESSADSTEQNNSNTFKDFSPYILKSEERPSVQVVFKNPSEDPLTVELVDTKERVIYSEEVASNQTYAQSISLKKLHSGSYQLRVSHDKDYRHALRINY